VKTYTTAQYHSDTPCVIALGCFDGVHKGHAAVIREAVRIAKETGVQSAVWTFEEPPRNFFSPGLSPRITDTAEKKRLVRRLGVDILVCIPFDLATGNLSPEAFFDMLCGKLCASHIVCGFNYSFGKGGAGNEALLRSLCERAHVGFSCVGPVVLDGETVSSTAVRTAVEAGDTEKAARLLDRPYAINTIVIDGQKLARRLGFPTVNQVFERGILIPRRGVYVTRVHIGSRCYDGVTNVGMRPTVGGTLLCAETHILGFSGNLYGKRVRVDFLHFLRPETAFSSVEKLADQVRQDIETAKIFLKQNKSGK